jgi:phospholipase C
MAHDPRRRPAWLGWSTAVVVAAVLAACTSGTARHTTSPRLEPTASIATPPPIQHLVVIYPENESFDHYFGTYPHAANPSYEPQFHAAAGTPSVNGLTTALLTHNPNGFNPHRFHRTQLLPCDNGHSYATEQLAFDHGRMDRFVATAGPRSPGCDPTTIMDYYDGNTVTALWNYAQRFAMSDNSHDATYGPTMPGHMNLVAGTAHGMVVTGGASTAVRNGTLIGNGSSLYDQCTTAPGPRMYMTGRNVGDLLDAGGVSWGWFSGGFAATSRLADGTPVCGARHTNLTGKSWLDYIAGAGTEPFQFWASTANPAHTAPASVAEIGHAGPANHQYDLTDFWAAGAAGSLPAVSFVKPPVWANGHPGNSDPLDEQRFLVDTINRIEQLPSWSSTAIVIAYDDSDGWYDHQFTSPTNGSRDAADALSHPGVCGTGVGLAGLMDRCGPGPRQPFLVISPFAKRNAVDHTLTTQVSITRFIEDNWLHGARIGGGSLDATAGSLAGFFDFTHPDYTPLILNDSTGEPI